MNYSAYIKNFKGRRIPEELESLLQFRSDLDTLSEVFDFRLKEDSDGWLTHWLNYQSQIVDSVLGIATNCSGDLLAFWLYDERELKDAPIVFVGHEGDVSVFANNFSDLLLLLIACDDLHPDSVLEDLEEPFDFSIIDEIRLKMVADGIYPPDTIEQLRKREEEIKKGRTEFISKLGLQPPRYPAALMRSAIQSHPNFQKWLDHQISTEQSNFSTD